MKTSALWNWTLGIALVALPLAGLAQDTTDSDAPAPEAAEQNLENAGGKVVSAANPTAAAANANLTDAAAEIVRLAQSGVDESVMLAYISNSANVFSLNSDQIIYLNDVGVSSSVVTAMMEHDRTVRNQPGGAPPAPLAPQAPLAQQAPLAPEAPQAPQAPLEAPLTPQPEVSDVSAPNVSYTYFYDSLSPYGNWVNVDGCGLCWQPTVVVADRGWQPYCNRGHWVYSDCGWFWASDYSWGWAAFHYGRWFHNSRFGWCWAPDTVWGPSWVCWRQSSDVCGWAPLPPTACFTPGIGFTFYGRHVAAGFTFGLSATHFSFVAVDHFCDPHPFRYRLPRERVTQVFNHTTVINEVVVGDHNRIINRGIPVDHVARATHADLRPVHIHDTEDFQQFRHEHGTTADRSLTVFHPRMPEPPNNTHIVGRGVPAAPHDWTARTHLNTVTPANRTISHSNFGANSGGTTYRNSENLNRNSTRETPQRSPRDRQANQPLMWHGANNANNVNNGNNANTPSATDNRLNPSGRTLSQPNARDTDTSRGMHWQGANPTPNNPRTRESQPTYTAPNRPAYTPEQRTYTPPVQPAQPRYTPNQPRYNQAETRQYTPPAVPTQPDHSTRNNPWSQATPRAEVPQQRWSAPPQERGSYNAPAIHESRSAPQQTYRETPQNSYRESGSDKSDKSDKSDRNPRRW
jgi:hypothetical protein